MDPHSAWNACLVAAVMLLAGCAEAPAPADGAPATDEPVVEPEDGSDPETDEDAGIPQPEGDSDPGPEDEDAATPEPEPEAEDTEEEVPVEPEPSFVESVANCTFTPTGRHPFLVLVPGHVLRLEGEDDGEPVVLTITVLDETEVVQSVETRVVEEREVEDGELSEVSRNFLAVCEESGSVFYFGEDVDNYDDGRLKDHEGAWRAGVDGAEAGVLLPGNLTVGVEFAMEDAPGIAEDRGRIEAFGERVETPAGAFEDTLRISEWNPLEGGPAETKYYARDVGLIVDEALRLASVTAA